MSRDFDIAAFMFSAPCLAFLGPFTILVVKTTLLAPLEVSRHRRLSHF
ncbi:MAG: hypothetical protein AAB835_00845 [Patescibacteria group bacterium]